MDSGNHPLENDYDQHDPWSFTLFLYEDITTDPAERKVDTWVPER